MDGLLNPNPWNFESIEDFHFYCCPECNEKTRKFQDLVDHALQNHANSIPTDILKFFKLTESKTLKNEKDVKLEEEVDISDHDGDLLLNSDEDELMPNQIKIENKNKRERVLRNKIDCEVCFKSFSYKDSLRRHLKRVHQITKSFQTGQFECEVCHKGYKNKEYLDKHKKEKHPITKTLDHENDVKLEEEVDKSDPNGDEDEEMPDQDKIDVNDRNKTEFDFHCDLCNDNFIQEEAYLEHFETVHQVVKPNLTKPQSDDENLFNCELLTEPQIEKKNKIDCEVCHKSFSHKDTLRRHLKRFHQITKSFQTGQFECEVCHKGYRNKEYLDKHKKEKHQITKPPHLKSHRCNLCDILFSTTLEFIEHIDEIHKVESGYKCDTCDIIIPTRSQFHSHTRIKKHLKDDKIWKCDECDITFEARWGHDYHRDTVHREMATTCDKCGKLCSSQRHLVIHMRRFHHNYAIPEDQKVKKCDKCDKNFKIATDFDEHLGSLHKYDKQFKCKECDTIWVSHLSLELHYIEKHEKFMFCCDICGYIAEQAGIVRRHIRNTHEGKKDHVCHICGKSFTKLWKVASHMALDHGIGECRFKCDYCGKGFMDNTLKLRHIEGVHEKNNVYKCDLCPYTGHSKSAMQKHKLRKHKKQERA